MKDEIDKTNYEANKSWAYEDHPRFTCDDCGCDRWFVVDSFWLVCANCHGSIRMTAALDKDYNPYKEIDLTEEKEKGD